jgi:hypothetical protein
LSDCLQVSLQLGNGTSHSCSKAWEHKGGLFGFAPQVCVLINLVRLAAFGKAMGQGLGDCVDGSPLARWTGVAKGINLEATRGSKLCSILRPSNYV